MFSYDWSDLLSPDQFFEAVLLLGHGQQVTIMKGETIFECSRGCQKHSYLQIETEHMLGSTTINYGQLSDLTLPISISAGPSANKVVIHDLRPGWALSTAVHWAGDNYEKWHDDDVTWTISISSTLTPLARSKR